MIKQKSFISIEIKVSNIIGPFVNLIITKVENFPIQMSITLRGLPNNQLQQNDIFQINLSQIIKIDRFNPKFDSDIFPELISLL